MTSKTFRDGAEARKPANEGRLQAFLTASFDVVYRMSPDWSELRQLEGKSFVSNAGGPLRDWIDEYILPEDQPAVRKAIDRAIQSKSIFELEHRVRRVDGTVGWILSRAVPVFDANGEIEEWFGAANDVTAGKQAEEAQRRLAAIVESSDDAIASKDLNGIVTSWNKSAERLFGYTAEEIVGRPITTIIPPELHRDEDMILGKIRRGEKIDHFETVRVTKHGERIDVSLTISPVKDEQGNVIGAAKIARNITENRKIERALRTTEKLAAAGRLAATVAHEINNPLEAVTNLVYLARRDATDSAKVARYLQLASHELDRVAHIARQTLGFYRDTSAPITFSIARTLDDVLFLYEKRLEVRKIQVIKQYDGNLEITAFAGEIRQALSNLISNSIDAMPGGGLLFIRARMSRAWSGPHQQGVRVTIADTGPGIPPQHRNSLYQPFFTTKSDVGTGLGLWVTHTIIQKHRGGIRVKSRVGPGSHGTAFSIFLPLGQASTDENTGAHSDVSANTAISSGASRQ
jgi:PAS domain S-box-containing protein